MSLPPSGRSREVVVSRAARQGFAEAYDRLARPGSGRRAWTAWIALRDAPDALAEFPYRGPPSTEHEGIRQLTVSGQRILHVVLPDTGHRDTAGDVLILAVVGPGAP